MTVPVLRAEAPAPDPRGSVHTGWSDEDLLRIPNLRLQIKTFHKGSAGVVYLFNFPTVRGPVLGRSWISSLFHQAELYTPASH